MRLTEFVICEDVRHERGDKFSLMGVLGPEIRLQSSREQPPTARLGAFIGIDLDEGDRPSRIEFEVKQGSEVILISNTHLPESARSGKRIQFAASGERIPIREHGSLEFSFVVRDAENREIFRDRKQVLVTIVPSL